MIERAIGFNSLLSRNFVVFAVRLSWKEKKKVEIEGKEQREL